MSQEITQLLSGLHPLERKVLSTLKVRPILWDHELMQETGLDESRLSMALGWLMTKGVVKVADEKATTFVSITELGKKYREHGMPEKRILNDIQLGKKLTIKDLRERSDMDPSEVSTAIGNLRSKDHEIVRVGQGGLLELTGIPLPDSIEHALPLLLAMLASSSGPMNQLELLDESKHLLNDILEKKWKTRGVVRQHEKKSKRLALTDLGYELVKRLTSEVVSEEAVSQLTPELLKDGAWLGKSFRKYNIGLKPSRMATGRKHPYREFLDSVKTKLVSMGFEEMRGPLVESEFWNSDALFMPQFHPARDIHDVYFVDHPKSVRSLPEPHTSQVAKTHETGWKTGSRGWRYAFDIERAKRLVLRSQGTSVSARTLAASPRIPGKYFSIARCFRYDLVDATHAPDFFQVEGIALGETITFRTLLGLLKLFATEMAHATEVKYLPAYFPYTEPSVEMHVRHPSASGGLGWMELGGAGLFRPEVTHPLGVKVPVIAWGLGLDRMAMVALGIQDIRDLFSSDLDLIRTKRSRG
ncbi:MAG: phenylalanine--tRNA ligase subunit alpha [Nitrospirae bacterium]|nr:phenylalanine--tRNA ligase subunit alpha [Nitrospirota bacterium]